MHGAKPGVAVSSTISVYTEAKTLIDRLHETEVMALIPALRRLVGLSWHPHSHGPPLGPE